MMEKLEQEVSFSDGSKMIQCGTLKLLFVESLEKPLKAKDIHLL